MPARNYYPAAFQSAALIGIALFALLCLLLLSLPDHWQQTLNYQIDPIKQGQLWRLLSANLLHTNLWHLLLNLAGLSLLLLLHQHHFQSRFYLLWLLVAGVLTNALLLLLFPGLDQLVGLSGALHAMVVLGALADIGQKDKTGWLLLALALAKVSYEQRFGPDPGLAQLIAAQVAVDAHLAGVVAGALLFPLWWVLQKRTTA